MDHCRRVVGGLLLVGVFAVRAGAQCEVAQLVKPVGVVDPYFAADVALSDGVAVVGTENFLFGNAPSWVYELQAGGWTAGSALPPDALVISYGHSVGVWGDTAVVAGQDMDDETVAAYVFERVGGAWVKSAKLIVPGLFPQITPGLRVAIEADTILVTDWNVASAYVFERVAGAWSLTQTLGPTGGVGSGGFGGSVSLRGGRAVVGGLLPISAGNAHGTAWVFERQGGVFVQTAQLVTTGGQDEDFAGQALAQSGDTIVLGAPGHGLGFPVTGIGAAFVFELEAGTWSQTAFVTVPFPQLGDAFGAAVALRDDLLVVGAPQRDVGVPDAGAAFAYRRAGSAWQCIATLSASVPLAQGRYGSALAIDGDTLLVAASYTSLTEDRVHVLHGMASLADWLPAGGAVGGAAGKPCAFGSGTPAVGAAASVTLVGAAQSAPAWLVLGIDRINAPFKGGVLVPAPQLLLPQVTSAAGGKTFGWTWPPGLPPGLVLALQHWIVDASAPYGLAGGNALVVPVP